MGCDIHCYVEKRRARDKRWDGFWPQLCLDRNYELFSRLAGVRGDDVPLVHPRGIPDDLGYYASNDWWLMVNDQWPEGEGSVSRATAESYRKYGKRLQEVGEGGNNYRVPRVEHPDWHTPGWVTPDELATVLAGCKYPCDEYHAITAAMWELQKRDWVVRLVFWFDN